jgi:hypothetical protein
MSLITVKVFYQDPETNSEKHYTTSTNNKPTDEEIRYYFMRENGLLNLGRGGEDYMVKVLRVEIDRGEGDA